MKPAIPAGVPLWGQRRRPGCGHNQHMTDLITKLLPTQCPVLG